MLSSEQKRVLEQRNGKKKLRKRQLLIIGLHIATLLFIIGVSYIVYLVKGVGILGSVAPVALITYIVAFAGLSLWGSTPMMFRQYEVRNNGEYDYIWHGASEADKSISNATSMISAICTAIFVAAVGIFSISFASTDGGLGASSVLMFILLFVIGIPLAVIIIAVMLIKAKKRQPPSIRRSFRNAPEINIKVDAKDYELKDWVYEHRNGTVDGTDISAYIATGVIAHVNESDCPLAKIYVIDFYDVTLDTTMRAEFEIFGECSLNADDEVKLMYMHIPVAGDPAFISQRRMKWNKKEKGIPYALTYAELLNVGELTSKEWTESELKEHLNLNPAPREADANYVDYKV